MFTKDLPIFLGGKSDYKLNKNELRHRSNGSMSFFAQRGVIK